MSLFGGTSFFGMNTGKRRLGRSKRNFHSASNERPEETIEPGVAACEGGHRRRTLQSGDGQRWSKMFGGGSSLTPRKGGIRKFTK